MAKQKISRKIAEILAQRIVSQIKTETEKKGKGIKEQLQKQLNEDVDVQKGMKLLEELKKVNTRIQAKFHKKWFNPSYQSGPFGVNPEIEKVVQDYKLKESVKVPSAEKVENDLLLESFFSEGVDAETIIKQYVDKYTK